MEELGMEAVWKIEVENFPAFIIVDDKGNDFFKEFSRYMLNIFFSVFLIYIFSKHLPNSKNGKDEQEIYKQNPPATGLRLPKK